MRKAVMLATIILFVSSAVALAVPGKKALTFDKSPMGTVIFDGTLHKEAGLKCKDCHNKGMFPKMKQGTVQITMNEIYSGKLCGVCHNGKRAFEAKGNCARCHVRK
jgi:c(7)-type cytochrome triheme protein